MFALPLKSSIIQSIFVLCQYFAPDQKYLCDRTDANEILEMGGSEEEP